MLGGCRNDNITRSALYVAMVHVFHYSVTMPVVMGYFNFTYYVARMQAHTHTQICTTALHLESGVFSPLIRKLGLFVSSK